MLHIVKNVQILLLFFTLPKINFSPLCAAAAAEKSRPRLTAHVQNILLQNRFWLKIMLRDKTQTYDATPLKDTFFFAVTYTNFGFSKKFRRAPPIVKNKSA